MPFCSSSRNGKREDPRSGFRGPSPLQDIETPSRGRLRQAEIAHLVTFSQVSLENLPGFDPPIEGDSPDVFVLYIRLSEHQIEVGGDLHEKGVSVRRGADFPDGFEL